MAVQTRSVLKTYFETGDKPTAAQFGDLIDSALMANFVQTSDITITVAANTTYWCTASHIINVKLDYINAGESCIFNRYGSAAIANSTVRFTGTGKTIMYAAGYSDVSADNTGCMSYAILVPKTSFALVNRAFYKEQLSGEPEM